MSTMEEAYSVVIRNATVIDGAGTSRFLGDLAILNDTIVSVGRIEESNVNNGTDIVIANGHFLAPGFIDSHTHDDVAVLVDKHHTAKTLQGVTTVVTGNCGFSNYPNGDNPLVQQHLSSLLGDVDPGNLYKDFSEFKSSLTGNGIGLNIASLVGHGPLRISVMGYENREATNEEVSQMCTLLEQQLQAGASGLSFGLVYPPSAYAGRSELIALAEVVARHEKLLAAHIRSYEGNLLSSIEEYLDVLRESRAKGLLSHLQVAGRPYWEVIMPRAIDMIRDARDEGIDVAVDMYPYLAGSSTILQLLPPSAMSGGFQELLTKLSDPQYRDLLKNMTESGSEPGWESKVNLIGWENIVLSSAVDPGLKQYEGMNFKEAAHILRFSEFEFCLYTVVTDEGKTNIIMFQQSDVDLMRVFRSEIHMIGSDSIPRAGGKPHPRMYASFPRVVGRFAQVDDIFPLEEAVRKATSFTAQRFGIQDRGIIRPGMKADLVLFTQEFLDQATFQEPTLVATGLEHVWVNGIRVVDKGQPLLTTPGKVI